MGTMDETVIIAGEDFTDTDPVARAIIDRLVEKRGLTERRVAQTSYRVLINYILRAEWDLEDLRDAEAALVDFDKNGGTPLEDLRAEAQSPGEAAFDEAFREAQPLLRRLDDWTLGHNMLVVAILAAACVKMVEQMEERAGRTPERAETLAHIGLLANRMKLIPEPTSRGN
jgi:hypothetical protein